MDLLTVKNEGMVSIPDGPNPIINPLGAPPIAGALSPGAAAMAAAGAAGVSGADKPAFLGILTPEPKNILFLGVVAFLIFKYGRKVQWL